MLISLNSINFLRSYILLHEVLFLHIFVNVLCKFLGIILPQNRNDIIFKKLPVLNFHICSEWQIRFFINMCVDLVYRLSALGVYMDFKMVHSRTNCYRVSNNTNQISIYGSEKNTKCILNMKYTHIVLYLFNV